MKINKNFINEMILGSALGDGYVNLKNKELSFTQNSKNEKSNYY